MMYISKPFEDLDIIDDFLMNALASDPEVRDEFCRTIYDIEPHKQKNLDLCKRNRFYQAKIDSQNLKAGEKDFVILPNLFVISITNYDPFGYDYMLYTVHNTCEEVPELKYEDGLCFLYFNTKGTKGGNSSIKKLLNYIGESKIDNVTDEATKKLHDCVSKVKVSPEVRLAHMTLEEKIFYWKRDAKDEERIRVLTAKLNKGKSLQVIADEMELSIEEIQYLVELMKNE